MSTNYTTLAFNSNENLSVRYGTVNDFDVISNPEAIDFQEHGLMVTWTEPDPPSNTVRHNVFIPYANLLKIEQGYTEAN